MDQILTMRVFARVVEAGSFTKAADSLALPKATVTKQIQHLEARLRVKLLHRTTRRVSVTPDGAAYYERAARLLNDLDELEASMGNAQTNPQGRLRVDVGSSVASLLIIPALSTFFDRYPDIQLDMGVSDRPVAGGTADWHLAFHHRGVARIPAPLWRAPAPARAGGGGHHMVNFFSPRTGRMFTDDFEKDGESIALASNYRIAVNESNAYLAAALAGLGVTQMVTFMAAPHLVSGALVPVLPGWKTPPIPVHVVYPPNRHLSAKVRSFVDWTAELFSQHAGTGSRAI